MNVVEEIIGNLKQRNLEHIIQLQQKIFDYQSYFNGQNLLIDVDDKKTAQTYFYLYTLPVLEALGFLEQVESAVFWGTVQLCLGLHLRYIDYIIDDDKIDKSRLLITKKSFNYLFKAQMLLNSKGYFWDSEKMAIYLQFFDYENEVSNGQFHDFGSLWRRVSPLCIISGSYLKSSYKIANFDFYYKRYISCSLLQADCVDVIKDIGQQKTPITNLLYDHDTQINKKVILMAEIINFIQLIIYQNLTRINERIFHEFPIWKIIIDAFILELKN